MTWADTELPILEAVRDAEESGREEFHIDSHFVSETTGLSYDVVCRSLRRLAQAGYVDMRDTSTHDGLSYHSIALTERGLRTVGPWPADEAVESFQSLIEQMIEREDNPERAGKLRKLAGAVGDVGKDVAGALLSAWLKQTAGL